MIAAVVTAATSIYLLLTIAAIVSLFSSDLTFLSLHGKTRGRPDLHEDECKDDSPKHWIFQQRRRRRLNYYFIHDHRFTIHKRRFIDFYITGSIITTLLILILHFNYNAASIMTRTDHYDIYHGRRMMLPIYLLLTHLFRRYWECKWVHQSNSPLSQMHLAGYLLGLLHYICLPFILLPSYHYHHNNAYANDYSTCAITHDVDDSSNNSNREVLSISNSCSKDDDVQQQYTILDSVVYILPIAGCVYFQYIQHIHHVILANLRKSKCISSSTSTSSIHQFSTPMYYSIPTGRWFHYISCPHYLSEIMIYFMLALLIHNNNLQSYKNTLVDKDYYHDVRYWANDDIEFSNISLVIVDIMHNLKLWILLLWVVVNLSISANRTHEWYRKSFGLSYPQERRRLIPFIW
jgi:3-oxo-5-alpha-steroid 4-dehydrogenase 3